MSELPQVGEGEVAVSAAAAKRVAKILSTEPTMNALRVSVEGGGCSGFSYKFDLTDALRRMTWCWRTTGEGSHRSGFP